MSSGPRTLVLHSAFAGLAPAFEAFGAVDRLWEISDLAAYAAGPGKDVRAMVGVGGEAVPAEVLDAVPNAGLIACGGTGVDGLDLADCRRRGLTVTNTAGLNAEDVADLAVGLLIACWRQILAGDTLIRSGQWKNRWAPMTMPRSLKGATLGIVGLGDIGKAIALRAEAFGMVIKWTGRTPRADEPRPYLPTVLDLAKASDALILAAPLTAETHHCVNGDVLAALGEQGVLVNIARGPVVDEDALIAALHAGTIRSAGLDVFDEEPATAERWRDVPRCILTPHIGGATRDSIQGIPQLVLENVRRFYAGEPLASPVK